MCAGFRVITRASYQRLRRVGMSRNFDCVRFPGEVVVAPGRSYFDTNTGHHHHFFVENDGELHDFPSDKVTIAGLPTPPKGTRMARVDVIVRVRR